MARRASIPAQVFFKWDNAGVICRGLDDFQGGCCGFTHNSYTVRSCKVESLPCRLEFQRSPEGFTIGLVASENPIEQQRRLVPWVSK